MANELERIATLLEEQLRWSRLLGLVALKPILQKELSDEKTTGAYFLSDGLRSTRDIAKLVKIGNKTVGNYWCRWEKLGIVEESTKFKGRMKHSFNLESVGIEIPRRFLNARSNSGST